MVAGIPLTDTMLFPLGILAGFIFGWIAARLLVHQKFSRIITDDRVEIATLEENNRNKIKDIEQLSQSIDHLRIQVEDKQAEISDLNQTRAELETLLKREREDASRNKNFITQSHDQLIHTFKALSANALKENNQSFVDLAVHSFSSFLDQARHDLNMKSTEVRDIVKPVKDALERYDKHVQLMELEREKAYGGLTRQMLMLSREQKELQRETGKLVKALQTPHTRGRWGEITLKRVAELSGMTEKCDFFEQETAQSDTGAMRPDMIVRLPNNRNIIVDAKVPLSAYLDAIDAETDQERDRLLHTHAGHVQTHVQKLAQKSYWTRFKPTPEFVVLFIPGENFFSAALKKNPNLIEEGVAKGIVIATPTTLISLLKAVSFGWRQEKTSENALAISELGHELYERLYMISSHVNKLGKDLDKSVQSYNQMIGSLEKRVFVTARKFEHLGVSRKQGQSIGHPEAIALKARQIDPLETDNLQHPQP